MQVQSRTASPGGKWHFVFEAKERAQYFFFFFEFAVMQRKELWEGGEQRKQKRYNFTAEHARLVFQHEQGEISHLR